MNALVLPNGIVVDDALFDRIKETAKQTVILSAPNPDTRYKTSTGNLALNSVRIKNADRQKMRFTVYVDEKRAPYRQAVTKKTHWANGLPYEYNEWFDQAAQDVATNIANIVGGKPVASVDIGMHLEVYNGDIACAFPGDF